MKALIISKDSMLHAEIAAQGSARLPAVLTGSSGFLYYVSVAGITGKQQAAPGSIEEAVGLALDERGAILQGKDASALHTLAMHSGMHRLYEDGLRKVATGMTSLDELLRVTQDQGET